MNGHDQLLQDVQYRIASIEEEEPAVVIVVVAAVAVVGSLS